MSLILISSTDRLGNHLFSIASAYGLSKQYKKSLKITSNFRYNWLYSRFEKIEEKDYLHVHRILEDDDKFCMIDTSITTQIQIFDDIIIKGYLQCEKYFSEYREELLNLFRLPSHIITLFKNTYPNFNTNSYFLHVRLGDYVNSKKHFVNL